MAEPIISFRQVNMAFGSKVILDQVSFDIYPGETFAVIGPSGTGKSTVLKLLIGLLAPDSGQIIVQGQDVAHFTEAQWTELRKSMGMVFQYSALFDFLTVAENVAFGLRQHTKLSEEEITQRVNELLELVGMSGTGASYPVELSGGMKKRISLARAIATNPKVVLYDEPTAGLDPIMANVINELIIATRSKYQVTSVLVTHDMVSAFRTADRIMMLSAGKIIETGTVEDFKASTNPLVHEFVFGEQIFEAARKGE